MDKNDAILALTKELVGNGYVNIIYDDGIKEIIAQNKKFYIPSLKAVQVKNYGKVDDEYRWVSDDKWNEETSKLQKKILEATKENPSANYLFVSNYSTEMMRTEAHLFLRASCIVHPLAAIGEEEIESLKEIYGGHPPDEIRKSADALSIDISVDYSKLYKKSPEKFKQYFSRLSKEASEEELNKMLPLIKGDEGLQEWLSKTVPDLAEKIARSTVVKQKFPQIE